MKKKDRIALFVEANPNASASEGAKALGVSRNHFRAVRRQLEDQFGPMHRKVSQITKAVQHLKRHPDDSIETVMDKLGVNNTSVRKARTKLGLSKRVVVFSPTEEQTRDIIERRLNGESADLIAKDYGISNTTVYKRFPIQKKHHAIGVEETEAELKARVDACIQGALQEVTASRTFWWPAIAKTQHFTTLATICQ